MSFLNTLGSIFDRVMGRTKQTIPKEVAPAYPQQVTETLPKQTTETRDDVVKRLSDWNIGEGSYYNPNDVGQTRPATVTEKTTGTKAGAYGRPITSGSVAFGNRYFHDELKQGKEILIEVDNLKHIKTPYGNGVFKIDDTMNQRYNKKGKFNIDFLETDLDKETKSKGRFPINWRIVSIK